MRFLVHVKPFCELSLFLSVLSLVNRGGNSFLLHYLPTLSIDLRCKSHALHCQFHFLLDPLLDALLLLLLPKGNRMKKFITESILLAAVFGTGHFLLLSDYVMGLVLFHLVWKERILSLDRTLLLKFRSNAIVHRYLSLLHFGPLEGTGCLGE